MSAACWEEATAWGERPLALAEGLGDEEIAAHALATIGACSDYGQLEESLDRARRAGRADLVGHVFVLLTIIAVEQRRQAEASKYLEAGIAFCSDLGLELFRLYLLAFRARLERDRGRWTEAADSAASVLRIPPTSNRPRIESLVCWRSCAPAAATRRCGHCWTKRGTWHGPRTSCRSSRRSRRQEPRPRGWKATATR